MTEDDSKGTENALILFDQTNSAAALEKARVSFHDEEDHEFYYSQFKGIFLSAVLDRLRTLLRTPGRQVEGLVGILRAVEPDSRKVEELAKQDYDTEFLLGRLATEMHAIMRTSTVDNISRVFKLQEVAADMWNKFKGVSRNPVWQYRVDEKKSLSQKWLMESTFGRDGPKSPYQQLPIMEDTLHLVSYLAYIGGHSEALNYLTSLSQNKFVKWQSYVNLMDYCEGLVLGGREGQNTEVARAILEKASVETRITVESGNYFFVNIYSGLSLIASRMYFASRLEERCAVDREDILPGIECFYKAIESLGREHTKNGTDSTITDKLSRKLEGIERSV